MSDTLLTRRTVKDAMTEEKLAERIRRRCIAAIAVGVMATLYFILFWPSAFAGYTQSLPGDVLDLLLVVAPPAVAFAVIVWLLQPMVRGRK
ncbi:MAG TPA: hypothetical protein VGO98_02650 [Candidatus Saccharimonadales bacterium]|jgi:hypothetical protein|nr:hypothetical protein [Candidatus Saccharimonadales bacterium]